MPTKIEWTDEVWNPISGCTKCSPGCLNCYAERMAKRQVAMGRARGGDNTSTWLSYSDAINPKTGKWSGNIALRYDQLDKPLHLKEPRRIFVCSMSDLFHPKVPFGFICKVFETIQNASQHTYLILTKRAKEMKVFFQECEDWDASEWPNVHLGVSISKNDEMWKVTELSRIHAAVRFISFEPLLEDIQNINIEDIERLDGAIIGCESGPNRRECKKEWVTDLVEDFQYFNKPVFVKQISVNGKVVKMPKEFPQELPERS